MLDVLLLSDSIDPEDWREIKRKLPEGLFEKLENAFLIVANYYETKGAQSVRLEDNLY
jgi:hypothetical protein